MNTVLIADKEQNFRWQIRQHIGARPAFQVIAEAENSFDTLRLIDTLEPDLLFLDVQLAGEKTFGLIRQASHTPKVIFTARNDTYARQAFDYQALDYLIKPYRTDRLETALQKISGQSAIEMNCNVPGLFKSHLFVENGKRLKRISIDEIQYLKASGDYTSVITTDGAFLSCSGISVVAQKLDPKQFMRVHRSFIINIGYIDSCHRDAGRLFLSLANGQEIAVGKSYLNEVKCLIL